MNTSVKIVDDQLICIKYNHKEQVMLVQVDDQVPFKDKFLCSKCLETHQNVAKIMSLKSVIDDIKEKIAKKNIKLDEEKQDSLKSIKQFCLKMNDLQTKVTKMFNEIQSITQQWIRDLEKLQSQNDVINIIKELEGNDSHQDNDVQKNNQAYFNKLSSTFKKLLEFKNYEDCYDDIKQMFIQKSPIGRQEQQPKSEIRGIFLCYGFQLLKSNYAIRMQQGIIIYLYKHETIS